MARYIGPTSRIARRFGEPIFGPDKALAKKAYGPDSMEIERRGKSHHMNSADGKAKSKSYVWTFRKAIF